MVAAVVVVATLAVLAAAIHPELRRAQPAVGLLLASSTLFLRGALGLGIAAYAAFVLPGTEAFHAVTHLCWHGTVPVLSDEIGLSGTWLAGAASAVPLLLLLCSATGILLGLLLAALRVSWWLRQERVRSGPIPRSVTVAQACALRTAGS